MSVFSGLLVSWTRPRLQQCRLSHSRSIRRRGITIKEKLVAVMEAHNRKYLPEVFDADATEVAALDGPDEGGAGGSETDKRRRAVRILSLSDRKKAYLAHKGSQFVDWCQMTVIGGTGGKGSDAFAPDRARRNPIGSPSGGNGGRGGNVVIRADRLATSLGEAGRKVRASNGRGGGADGMYGATGEDAVVRVPVGTVVYQVYDEQRETEKKAAFITKHATAMTTQERNKMWVHTRVRLRRAARVAEATGDESVVAAEKEAVQIQLQAEKEYRAAVNDARERGDIEKLAELAPSWVGGLDGEYSDGEMVVVGDLVADGDEVVVAEGGAGGLGVASSPMKFNNQYSAGAHGEERKLQLELKTLADAGLIGCPNAGKSTFLRAISRARPKIASYPFTTLRPHVGVVEFEDDASRIVVADIPGLIEGAHANIGLGHSFLRHIERSRMLVYIVDGTRGGAAVGDLEMLMRELRLYREELGALERIVLVNKMDVGGQAVAEAEAAVRAECARTGTPVFAISGLEAKGVMPVCEEIRRRVRQVDARTHNDSSVPCVPDSATPPLSDPDQGLSEDDQHRLRLAELARKRREEKRARDLERFKRFQ